LGEKEQLQRLMWGLLWVLRVRLMRSWVSDWWGDI
jgi:hypothetical protein